MKTPTQTNGSEISAPQKTKPTLYLSCKLYGASLDNLRAIKRVVELLEETGRVIVLPIAYDFDRFEPLGNPAEAWDNAAFKVQHADLMVTLLMGDTADERGMEIMMRMSLPSAKRRKTLVVYDLCVRHSPFYDCMAGNYGMTVKGIVFDRRRMPEDIMLAIEEWLLLVEESGSDWQRTTLVSQGVAVPV